MSRGIELRLRLKLDSFTLDFDQCLPARGVTAISGCGKSTLLRCIAGLERPETAYINIAGECWEDTSKAFRLPTHRRSIGYVFQEASLFPHLTVLKNLQFGQQRSGAAKTSDQFTQAVELLGIESLLERKPERLSGGERQRVAIARALAVCPQLLLMDEPLAALDMRRKREILPFLEQVHRELDIPVLYVTHSPAEVRRMADHLIVMEEGKVIANGLLAETEHHLIDEETLLGDSNT